MQRVSVLPELQQTHVTSCLLRESEAEFKIDKLGFLSLSLAIYGLVIVLRHRY